jgi:hypothetical protein
MGQKQAASVEASRGAGNGIARGMALDRLWPRNPKAVGLGFGILLLAGIVAFGVLRETATTNREPAVVSRPAAAPSRPAWTRAEEAYIQALWPIHGQVESITERLSLGKIF